MNEESSSAFESEGPSVKRWPPVSVWIGPILTIAGALSYFLYFFQFPILRDFPLLNLPIVLLGLALTGTGCWRMFTQRRGVLGKAFSSIAFLVSLGFAGLFSFYIFFLSYQLPSVATVPDVQASAPDFVLLDQNGEQVRLSDYRGSKVILVFYRGHW